MIPTKLIVLACMLPCVASKMGMLTINAETRLPDTDTSALNTALNASADGIAGNTETAGLLGDDLMPDPALLLERDRWSVVNRTEGAAKVGFVFDIGLQTARIDTIARVADGSRAQGAGLSVMALSAGTLSALRDIPLAEAKAPKPIPTLGDPDAADPPSEKTKKQKRDDKAREIGTFGLGGAFQYIRADATTRALVGGLDSSAVIPLTSLSPRVSGPCGPSVL